MRILLSLIIVILVSNVLHAETNKPVHIIQFSDYETGSEEDWLLGKGFQFKHDALNRKKIDFEVSTDGLLIEAKRHAFGILPNETVNIAEFSAVEIDWGVNKFPEGASYEQKLRNESLLVLIFMGDERLPSGSIFIPDSPYFIGLFLCHDDDKIRHPYIGAYFKKSGRYVCLDKPETGNLVTTRFNLLESYRIYFDKERDDDPAISGIALALDTKKASGKGKSSAFIKEIRFYR